MASLTSKLYKIARPPIVKEKKLICMEGDYLGSIKQMPFLIRAIQEILPETEIMINCQQSDWEILKKDLCFEGISQDNIITKQYDVTTENKREKDIHLLITTNDYSIGWGMNYLYFWIDPLKFEKRRLLNESEIGALKEKYKIREDEHVVLGGSLNIHEMKIMGDISQEILKENPKIKFVLVPRKTFNWEDFEGKRFEIDSSITGKERYLLIEEKGCLDKLYAICNTAIIGNTFTYCVGQNPLEPAFYGKRTLYGNHDDNWNKKAYDRLRERGLLVKVNDIFGLRNALLNPPAEEDLEISRQKAKEFIESNQGAATEYAKLIKGIINGKIKLEYYAGKKSSDILPFWDK